MKTLLLITFIFSLLSCKQSSLSESKMVFGKLSDMKASVVPIITFDKSGKLCNCTGSIIKERGHLLLLTAIHCVVEAQSAFIVDSRNPGETTAAWYKRVLSERENAVRVSIKGNDRFLLSTGSIERSGYDFAVGFIKKKFVRPELYSLFQENALEIGYDIDISPENLKNKISYIGTGRARIRF